MYFLTWKTVFLPCLARDKKVRSVNKSSSYCEEFQSLEEIKKRVTQRKADPFRCKVPGRGIEPWIQSDLYFLTCRFA